MLCILMLRVVPAMNHRRKFVIGGCELTLMIFVMSLPVALFDNNRVGNIASPVFKKIALEGNIAAGKSTLLRLLED